MFIRKSEFDDLMLYKNKYLYELDDYKDQIKELNESYMKLDKEYKLLQEKSDNQVLEFQNQLKELENKIINLRDQSQKESQRLELAKLQLKEKQIEVRGLKYQLDQERNSQKNIDYKSNLIPAPKKVTKELVIKVKDMIKEGNTYRVIAKVTDISIKTISRIKQGYYDNLI